MGKPLLIEVERTLYTAGETVRGKVMAVEALDKAKDLTVELVWAGKRIGDQSVGKLTLKTGPVAAGESFDFEIPIPLTAPFSFEGHAHSVYWRAKATADVPWAIDPKAEQTLKVQPQRVPNDPQRIADVVGEPAAEEPGAPVPKWLTYLIIAILGPIVIALMVVLLPFVLYWVIKAKLINTRLKSFEVEIPKRPTLLGEWAPVAVRFKLKKAIALERVKVLFRGIEKWSTGSGKNRRTHYHTFYEQELSELPETIVAVAANSRDSEVVVRTAVQLPIDGLPSVLTDSVYYELKATAEIKGWPDPSAQQNIPALSAALERPADAPPAQPVKETSREVVVLVSGERPPLGVDTSTAMGGIWIWLFMPVIGLGLGIAGIFTAVEGIAVVAGVPVLLVAGAGLLVIGLLGLILKIFR